jgi:hypothetical protein
MSDWLSHERKWVWLSELETLSLVHSPKWPYNLTWGWTSTLDAYGWVENCSYTTNCLNYMLLNNKCFVFVYEYTI